MKNFFYFISALLFTVSNLIAQDWKNYPYQPEGAVISFPQDEGRHTDEPEEWWYTTAHLKGVTTGNDYSIMLTYFYHPGLGFDGFRIFNIANETTGDFYPDTQPCNYTALATDRLHINAHKLVGDEVWETLTDDAEELLPFQYHLSANTLTNAIDLTYNTVKRPLILGDTGYFDQGISSYTYYYEQTGIEVAGTVAIGGTEEEVTGTAWIDRQYGNFNPNAGEAYEWFSVQLSNGMDMSFWDIFTIDNDIPDTITYRMLNVYQDEETAYTTSDFVLKRLKYSFTSGSSNCYANQWQLTSPQNDIDLTIAIINPDSEVQFPFQFIEGSTTISGTVNGVAVTGVGFIESLHRYAHPVIEFNDFGMTDEISWWVTNPDAGRPLQFDVAIKNHTATEYTYIATGITDMSISNEIWNTACENNCDIKVTGYSIDTTLIGEKQTHKQIDGIATFSISSDLILSPNPVANRLVLDIAELSSNDIKLHIFDSSGKNIVSQNLTSNQLPVEIHFDAFPKGLYYIEVLEKNHKHIGQIIKK